MEKTNLPNAKKSLIFGIVSIVTACCCAGFPGLIFGYLGYKEATKAKAIYDENPDLYHSVGNADTGRITSIIGMVLGAIFVLQLIYAIVSGSWQEQMDMYRDFIEQNS